MSQTIILNVAPANDTSRPDLDGFSAIGEAMCDVIGGGPCDCGPDECALADTGFARDEAEAGGTIHILARALEHNSEALNNLTGLMLAIGLGTATDA